MGLLDEINSVDIELEEKIEAKRKELLERKNAEIKRKEEEAMRERTKKKNAKIENIQKIMGDRSDESLDEPHVYVIHYYHPEVFGYGLSWSIAAGYYDEEVIMTEREKEIAMLTGKIFRFISGSSPKIINVTESNRELTDEEKLKLESIKKKVAIIKNSEEGKNDCDFEIEDNEFGILQLNTSLENALLSSVSIKNGIIIDEEEKARREEEIKERERKKEKRDRRKNGRRST